MSLLSEKHKFILIADDQAIIEFNPLRVPYTPEQARQLSEQVSQMMKTKASIILSPDFEMIDKRPGYLKIEERLEALEKRVFQPQTVNTAINAKPMPKLKRLLNP